MFLPFLLFERRETERGRERKSKVADGEDLGGLGVGGGEHNQNISHEKYLNQKNNKNKKKRKGQGKRTQRNLTKKCSFGSCNANHT